MVGRDFIVQAHWDAEAKVYWAESDDVPGLATEAATFEELVANVRELVPELLRLNNHPRAHDDELPFRVTIDRQETLRLPA